VIDSNPNDGAFNTVTATITVGSRPWGVAFAATADGKTTKAYVTNSNLLSFSGGSPSVSVIDSSTNTVLTGSGYPIQINDPFRVAVSPDGTKVYVVEDGAPGTVSVIDTAKDTVTATIPVGYIPLGVAVHLDGSRVYVTNEGNASYDCTVYNCNTVSVIDTNPLDGAFYNTVIGTIPVGTAPAGVAAFTLPPIGIAPPGVEVLVANSGSNNVSVIANTNTTVGVGTTPFGVAATPDRAHAYVTNFGDGTVSVIDSNPNDGAKFNTVTAAINVGSGPTGVAVAPLPPSSSTASVTTTPSSKIATVAAVLAAPQKIDFTAVNTTITLPTASGTPAIVTIPSGYYTSAGVSGNYIYILPTGATPPPLTSSNVTSVVAQVKTTSTSTSGTNTYSLTVKAQTTSPIKPSGTMSIAIRNYIAAAAF
jgi:YVTN family beta-propeller protein